VSDFPSAVKATDDEAEFVLQGGRDLVPLLIAGLSDYRGPTLERLTSQGWQPLALSRADDKDGVQVFCEAEGRFAAVLLAQGGSEPQRLRFGLRPDRTPPNRMTVRPSVPSGQPGPPLVQISSDTPGELLGLEFPAALDVRTAREPVSGNPDPGGTVFPGEESSSWSTRTGNAIQYQVRRHGCLVGGRLTPNEYDVDLEFWIRNERDVPLALTTWFAPVLAGTSYDDPGLERTWVLLNGKWVPLREAARPAVNEIAVSAVAIEAQSGHRLLGFVWPGMRVKTALGSSPKIQFGPAWPECPPGRRAYRSGKVYWAVQTLDELRARVE
jgi:hypothetical protein